MRKKPRILWHQLLFASESFTWNTTGNPSGRPPTRLIRNFFASPYRSHCKSYGRPALAFCLQALSWCSSIFLCNQREPLGIYLSPSAFVILHIASDVKYRSDHVKQQKKKTHIMNQVMFIKLNKTKESFVQLWRYVHKQTRWQKQGKVETWCKTGCSCLCRVSTEVRELHTQALTRQLFLFFPNRAKLCQWAARHETEQHNLMLYSNKKP